jgi:hypothetical protein
MIFSIFLDLFRDDLLDDPSVAVGAVARSGQTEQNSDREWTAAHIDHAARCYAEKKVPQNLRRDPGTF